MRLEMVDVLLFTADNIYVADRARIHGHPPVWGLGEVDDKYTIQNSWDPVISSLEVWKSNQRNAIEIQRDNRKSDTLIVLKKLLITVEGRGVHFIASSKSESCRQRRADIMVNELLGIQYNIAKANVTDRKVQNLASYINVSSLRAIHKTIIISF